MDAASIQSAYRRYAGFYDFVFGISLNPGRRQALRQIEWSAGNRVLEIGIGTGLSIPFYPPDAQLTGIDACAPMLEKALGRAKKSGRLRSDLQLMDAENLEFKDDSFDQCLALYVASVIPNPAAMVQEMKRVTRPGGYLYILSHFSRRHSMATIVEKGIKPLASVLGFEPVFYQDDFIDKTGLAGAEDIPTRPFGYWRILKIKNAK